MLDPTVEQAIADMSDDDFNALVARTRPPIDPRAAAAQALRDMRATGRTGNSGATGHAHHPGGLKADAVDALRALRGRSGHQPSDRGPALDTINATGIPATYDGRNINL